MSLQPETADTGSVVNTDLTGASDDTAAEPGSIFTETTDDAAPPPARPPLVSPEETKRARLENVKALAAATKRLTNEQQRYEHDRQKTAHENAILRQEFEALRARPWEYIRDRHGVTLQSVGEAELLQGSDESAATRAEKLALQTQQRLDEVLNHVRTTAERDQRIQAWDSAKAQALKEYEAKASTEFADLDAWASRQATKTGVSKQDLVVQEMLDAVQRIKANPKTAPFAASYSDLEILQYVNSKYDGFAPAQKKPHSSKTLAAGQVSDEEAMRGTVFGSQAYYKLQAKSIVDAYRAAKGIKDPEPRLYSPQELADLESKIYGSDARFNKEADRKHSAALVETERAKAKLRSRS
jgi:hypothetical protein